MDGIVPVMNSKKEWGARILNWPLRMNPQEWMSDSNNMAKENL